MIVLSKSNRFSNFFCVKDILSIPIRYTELVNNRKEVFDLHLQAIAPITASSAQEISSLVEEKYRIKANIAEVIGAWRIVNIAGVSFDFCYKVFLDYSKTNKLYKIKPDPNVEAVYSSLFFGNVFEENKVLIWAILETFYKKISQTELDMLKENRQDTSIHYKNLANYVWLMEALNYYKDSGNILKLLNTKGFFDSNILVARNKPDHVAVFDGQEWKSLKFKETNNREFVYDKITFKHLKLDSKTLFQISSGTFHMRDDVLPKVCLRDGQTNVEPDAVVPNKAYFCDVRYPVLSYSDTEDLEIEAVPTYGCTFKDTNFSMKHGVGTTQVIINDKEFRFKIKSKDRLLPSCYIHNTKQISIDKLPWLDK